MTVVEKNPSVKVGDIRDVHLNRGLGRFCGGRQDNPFHYSCLRNPMDRGAWRATVYVLTKNQTRLKLLGTHTPTLYNLKAIKL